MTKIITTLATLLFALAASAQSPPKTIEIDIRGRSCAGGSGICSSNTILNKNTEMKLYNTIKVSETEIIFEIDNQKLSAEDQEMFFGKEFSKITPSETLVFIQEQDYLFDTVTLRYLDLDINHPLMKRGTYPITIKDNKVQVAITLSKKER